MTDFAWLIEAPGQNYLATREIGHHPEFFWSRDHARAVRFISAEQAYGVMMAVRRMEPALWAFAANLGEARPVEHGWATPTVQQASSGGAEAIADCETNQSSKTPSVGSVGR